MGMITVEGTLQAGFTGHADEKDRFEDPLVSIYQL